MSKEYLEAWNFIKEQMQNFTFSHLVAKMVENADIVDNALQRLESIDNANPSKALECWQWINATIPQWVREKDKEHPNVLEPIKQYILKAQEQDFNYNKIVIPFLNKLVIILGINDMDEMIDKIKEQERVLEIIKEKNVNIAVLKNSPDLKYYNYHVSDWRKLTQEEFDLLKRWQENGNL